MLSSDAATGHRGSELRVLPVELTEHWASGNLSGRAPLPGGSGGPEMGSVLPPPSITLHAVRPGQGLAPSPGDGRRHGPQPGPGLGFLRVGAGAGLPVYSGNSPQAPPPGQQLAGLLEPQLSSQTLLPVPARQEAHASSLTARELGRPHSPGVSLQDVPGRKSPRRVPLAASSTQSQRFPSETPTKRSLDRPKPARARAPTGRAGSSL